MFNYTADVSNPGVKYPVSGQAGILNTTWTHTIDPNCNPNTTAETEGIGFPWTANDWWFEIGDGKYSNYLASGYGQGFYEYGYFDNNTPPKAHPTHVICCENPVTDTLVGLEVAYTGSPTIGNRWTVYWDPTGTEAAFNAIHSYCCFPSDRGEGWTESSGYGMSTLQSQQTKIEWRCPCNGLWTPRAAHTQCYDNTTQGDPQPSAYNVQLYNAEVTNDCYP